MFSKSGYDCYFSRLGLSGLTLPATINHVGNVNKEKNRFFERGENYQKHILTVQEVETEPVKIDSVQAALGDMRTRWGHFIKILANVSLNFSGWLQCQKTS